MDIWKWVYDLIPELRKNGHGRLAELMHRLPSETVDDHHERVDAIAPEALALARAAEHPWAEVFVRHWHLQSRVLHRGEGETALGEAVALVDFSHGDRAHGCPQAVCTVQDLAACYAKVDGPGWAPERREVSRETLARIDPTWPCFTCISTEHSAALRDDGQLAAALEFLDAQQRRLVDAGKGAERYSLLSERIQCLLDLGRVEDALAATRDALENGRRDEFQRTARRIDLARALIRLGRAEEARRELPQLKEIWKTPDHYEPYTDALVRLVDAGAVANTSALGQVLQRFVTRLATQGSYRAPLAIATHQARLACERGAPPIARLALGEMRRLADRLRRPLDAPARLADIERRLADAAARPVPEDSTDAEDHLIRVEAALESAPDDPRLILRRAELLTELGFARDGVGALEAFVAAHPDDHEAALHLATAYQETGQEVRHRELADRLIAREDPAARGAGHWLHAQRLAREGDFAGSDRHVDRILASHPEAVRARMLGASNARARGDWARALTLLDEVVAREPEAGAHDWDRMVAATLLGAWDRVRHSAARVGIELDATEGPIEERWGLCRIRVEHPDGGQQDLYAARTGPVTAELVQISRLEHPQRFGDVVVFDARPVGETPAGGESDERPVYTYAEVAPLRRSGARAFALDGVHPGDDVVEALREAVQAQGGSLQVQSGERYRLRAPDDGRDLPGWYAFAALPPDADLAATSAALRERAAALQAPLVWPRLAEAAGDLALAQEQDELAVAWGLL